MLPSGTLGSGKKCLTAKAVATGMYVVENAYEAAYDFFAPSVIFSEENKAQAARKAASAERARDQERDPRTDRLK
jgi:hypothetical protein